MKLIHFSDLHLGIETHGSISPETGLSTRVHDTLEAFDRIVDRAIDESVDAVLFAGDAFKNRDPNPTLQREFARRIARLAAADIPIVLLMGNHDLPNVHTRAAAVDIYPVLDVSNVIVANELDRLEVPTASGPLQVVAIPWISRSRLLASEQFRQLFDQDLLETVEEAIAYRLHDLTAQLDPNHPAILLAHLTVHGATFGHERSIMLGQDLVVDPQSLRVDAFDYVALGHIHKHQQIRSHPPVVYAGSPERVDFGEESEPKGYVLVGIDTEGATRQASWEFVELPARRFATLRIDARRDEPATYIERAIHQESERIDSSVVRCIIDVPAGSESLVSAREVRGWIEAHKPFAVAGVIIRAEQADQARVDIDADDALDFTQMLERWLEVRDYDDEFEDRIRRIGTELILEHRDGST